MIINAERIYSSKKTSSHHHKVNRSSMNPSLISFLMKPHFLEQHSFCRYLIY